MFPEECSRVLRTNPDITTIDAAVTRAKLLLTVSVEKSALSVAAVTDTDMCPEVRALQDSVQYLTEQMSTLMEKLQEHTYTAARLLFLSDAITVTALDTYRGTADSQDVSQCACYSYVARDCQHQGNGLGMTTSKATGHSARV